MPRLIKLAFVGDEGSCCWPAYRRSNMNLNLMLAVMLIVAATTIAQAQQFEPGGHPIKPTLQEAQRLVQTITSDREKLQVYCEIGKLQDEMDKAEEKNDTQKLQTLGAK